MELILASASPRRKELLTQCGLTFRTAPQPVDESLPASMPPKEAVAYLSRIKALASVKAEQAGVLVIGADTVVALDGAILGKPKDEDHAERMLQALSGRTHEVYTGVTFAREEDAPFTFTSVTRVTFYSLGREEIKAYIATGEPMDKAGAYGIQGRGGLLVKRIEGDYYTVVGLPIAQCMRELARRYPQYKRTAGK